MDLTFPRLGSLFLVAILAAGCSAWLHPRYERTVERHHTTDGEREAIAAAEHLDYDRYLPPGADIVDSEVLDRFDAEFRGVKAESGSV